MKRLALALFALAAFGASAGAQVVPSGTNPVPSAGAYNSSAPTCTSGQYCAMQVDVNGQLKIASVAATIILPILSTTSSVALAANTVVNATAASLYSFNISADSTLSGAAWWIMIYNATSAPADGAVTPLKCYAMSSGTTSYSGAFPNPVPFSTGIVIGVSTTGCFTKTASTHAFISGDYK